MDVDGAGSQQQQGAEEFVEPEVDTAAVQALMDMGFGRNRALRAVYCTGSTSVEQCVQWIMDHEADEDLDNPLLVPKSKSQPQDTKPLDPVEAMARLEELRKKAKVGMRPAIPSALGLTP